MVGVARRGLHRLERLAELALDDAAGVLVELRELTQCRQIFHRFEPEELQKLRRGSVKQRTTGLVFLPEDADQIALEEQLEHGPRVDTANVVDLGARDGLPVGEDGERLDLRARELHRLLLGEIAYERRVGSARAEDPAARDLVELHAAVRVADLELAKQVLHVLQGRRRRLRQLGRFDRPITREHERLEQPCEVRSHGSDPRALGLQRRFRHVGQRVLRYGREVVTPRKRKNIAGQVHSGLDVVRVQNSGSGVVFGRLGQILLGLGGLGGLGRLGGGFYRRLVGLAHGASSGMAGTVSIFCASGSPVAST